MKALVFPGQGSQFVGMGKLFYEKSVPARKIFDLANSVLGYSLTEVMFNSPIEQLTKTSFAQPALLTVSYAMLSEFLNKENKFINDVCSFVAGHSLGEYGALVAANVLSFEDALKLVQLRGEAMESSFEGCGIMAAILGIDYTLLATCLPKDQTCVIANDNAPGQIVISGEKESTRNVIALALEKGAKRCIELPVSAAFHSPYMKKAEDKMEKAIENVTFKNSVIPVIPNILAYPLTNGADIKACLKQQICKPVRWRESINYLYQNGVTEILEMGAGCVLTGLNKRIEPEILSTSYQSIFDKAF